MNAQIKVIADHADTGTTEVQFGPPEFFGPADIIELLRVNRRRQVITSPQALSDSHAGGGGGEVGSKLASGASTGE